MTKRLATNLDIGIRPAARANCSSDINTFQHAMKGSVLHCFDVHTHCEETFCNAMRGRMDTLRLFYAFNKFKSSYGFKTCLPCTVANVTPQNACDASEDELSNNLKPKTSLSGNIINKTDGETAFLLLYDKKV